MIPTRTPAVGLPRLEIRAWIFSAALSEIEIIGAGIQGILDLTGFNNLIKLNCSDNYIVSIINLPASLQELECKYCILKELDGLPSSLTKLDCSYNKLMLLNNLPGNLEELVCMENILINLDVVLMLI